MRIGRLPDFAFVYGARVAQATVGLALAVAIARVLGPEQRGWYFLAITVALGFYYLASLSVDQGIFWAVSERGARIPDLLRGLAGLALAITLAGCAAYLTLGVWTGLTDEVPLATALAASLMIPASAGRLVVDGALYAVGAPRVAALGLFVWALAQLALVAGLIVIGELDSTTVVIALGLSGIIGLGPGVAHLWRSARGVVRRRVVPWGRVVVVGLQNHVGVLSLWLARRVDVIVIAPFVSPRDLGLYTIAVTLTEFLLISSEALAQAGLGRQGRLERGAAGAFSTALAADAVRLGVAQAVAVALVGYPFLRYALGAEWAAAYPVLIGLLPGIVCLTYVRPLIPAFVRANRSLEMSAAVGLAAAVKVVGTILLAPGLGLAGVAGVASVAWALAAGLIAWRAAAVLGIPLWAPSRIPGALARLAGNRDT